jgi:hypothetical protein
MKTMTTTVFSAEFVNADNISFDIYIEQATSDFDVNGITVHAATFTVWIANNATDNMGGVSFGKLEGGLDRAFEFVQELISEIHLTVVDKPAYKTTLESEGDEDSAEGQLRLESFVTVEYRQKRGTYLTNNYRVAFENASHVSSSEFDTYAEAKERFDSERDE